MERDFTLDWISKERGMEDIYTDKQAVWDAIVAEYPMMAYSPIFKEGWERWEAGGGITQSLRNIFARVLDVPFDVGGTGRGKHITVSPSKEWTTERDTHALVGHEISHLGLRLDEKNPFKTLQEEDLNRLHDRIYQPSSYVSTEEKAGIPYLMNQGYIEQTNIPGRLSYVGSQDGNYGTQYTNRGNEFIRESGLPQHQQRALGYYESPPQTISNQKASSRPIRHEPVTYSRNPRHHALNTGGLASLRRY